MDAERAFSRTLSIPLRQPDCEVYTWEVAMISLLSATRLNENPAGVSFAENLLMIVFSYAYILLPDIYAPACQMK